MLCTPGNLDGRRWDTVGITGPSHAVIHNLLGQVIARAGELDVARPRIGQRPGQDTSYLHPGAAGLEHAALETGLRDGDLDIGAGTAWLWARAQFQASVDTLFVGEAGQMPLASILAVAGAARNLVLIGRPLPSARRSAATPATAVPGSPWWTATGSRCAALTETAAGQLPARRRPAKSSRRPWCATRRPARLSRH